MAVDTMELVCYAAYRVFVPAVLLIAALVRINALSLMWLLFFLVLPCLPKFTYRNWSAHPALRIYLLLLLLISTLACCGHVVFYSLELSDHIGTGSTNMCNETMLLLMNIGYQKVDPGEVPLTIDRIRLLMPDFVVFLIAAVTTCLCFNASSPVTLVSRASLSRQRMFLSRVWRTVEPYVTCLFLFLAGALAPSLVCGVYFVIFVIIATLWALGIKIGKLPHLKLFLLFMVGAHIVLLYLYQFQPVHDKLKPDSLPARLLGFVQYVNRDCNATLTVNGTYTANPLQFAFQDNLMFGNFAFVVSLLALYFALGLSARYMLKVPEAIDRDMVRDKLRSNTLERITAGFTKRSSVYKVDNERVKSERERIHRMRRDVHHLRDDDMRCKVIDLEDVNVESARPNGGYNVDAVVKIKQGKGDKRRVNYGNADTAAMRNEKVRVNYHVNGGYRSSIVSLEQEEQKVPVKPRINSLVDNKARRAEPNSGVRQSAGSLSRSPYRASKRTHARAHSYTPTLNLDVGNASDAGEKLSTGATRRYHVRAHSLEDAVKLRQDAIKVQGVVRATQSAGGESSPAAKPTMYSQKQQGQAGVVKSQPDGDRLEYVKGAARKHHVRAHSLEDTVKLGQAAVIDGSKLRVSKSAGPRGQMTGQRGNVRDMPSVMTLSDVGRDMPSVVFVNRTSDDSSSPSYQGDRKIHSVQSPSGSIEICSTTPICQQQEEQERLLDNEREGRAYNSIAVDGLVDDATQLRGSIRERKESEHSNSTYKGEEEDTHWVPVIRFLMRLLIDQVYLLTLAVLMLWAIHYISWLNFVLLVLVCFLCICPKAKEASYSVAYPLVGYGTILVLIQYIYGLDLYDSELAQKQDIGLKRFPDRGSPVFFKTIYLFAFWLHLRAYLYQNEVLPANQETLRHSVHTYKIYQVYQSLRHLILTYWPVLCYAALVMASLLVKGMSIMRIIYLLFFVAFMFGYVVHRRPLEIRVLWLWYLLICYAMVCVILLYTYQFTTVSKLWKSALKKEMISDIGLMSDLSTPELFIQLIVPIFVLLFVTIQLRVFRTPLLDSGATHSMEPPEEVEEDGQEQMAARRRARAKSQTYIDTMASNMAEQMKEFWKDSKTLAARGYHIFLAICEMHSPKIVSLGIFFVCVWRVNTINVVLLAVTVISIPWPLVQYKLTIPIFCWVTFEIVSQLIYQLDSCQDFFADHLSNFTVIPCNNDSSPPLQQYQCGYKEESDVQWLGYKQGGKEPAFFLLWGYLMVIVFLVIQRLLVHYMKGRRSPYVYILREGIFPDFIFPNITKDSSESKLSFQLMYLCNNFFVLFGTEVVYALHVIVAAVRFDVYGVFYIVLLGIWQSLSKQRKSKVCIYYIVLVEILITVQYLLLLGPPPGLCTAYPWCHLQTEKKFSLLVWLYLPTAPNTMTHWYLLAGKAEEKHYCLVNRASLCDGWSSCLTDECGCDDGVKVFYCADKNGCIAMDQVGQIDRILCMSLTIYDTMMGLYLLVLVIKMFVYRGSYCIHDLAWRSSLACSATGVMFSVSVQGSLLTAMMMSVTRCHTCLRPFDDKSYLQTMVALVGLQAGSLIICVTPILPISFVQNLIQTVTFFNDFILLLALSRQWHVFKLEELDGTLGGALDVSQGPDFCNPRNKSTLNSIKLFIFTYLWWVTSAVIFLNAVTTISIFSAGFLISCFWLLWQGHSQLVGKKQALLKKWNTILIYAYFVILVKIILQVPACVAFLSPDPSGKKIICVLVDLFNLFCLQKKSGKRPDATFTPWSSCSTSKSISGTGLTIDAITFVFLLVQIRVFSSPYFTHAVRYLKILIDTSAQGAEIMKHRMDLRTKMNHTAHDANLSHIKQHVAKLKAFHAGCKDYNFGTAQLVREAEEYWKERDRREEEEARKKEMLPLTMSELYLPDMDENEDDTAHDSSEIMSEPRVRIVTPGVEEALRAMYAEAGETLEVPDDDIRVVDDVEGGGEPVEDEDAVISEGEEVPVWTTKPPKPDKSSSEVMMELIEYTHDNFIDFIEYTISWLDDQSGDYRYTSAAIFKERYKGQTSPLSSSLDIVVTDTTEASVNSDILEEVPPSSVFEEHMILRLLTAFYYFCLARTELLCFFFMILNHLQNANLISLVYPVLAFLWGMVAFPRPSGIFWYIIITYCEISIILKYIFQFKTIEWNDASKNPGEASSPTWAPTLIGLTKEDMLIQKTVYDLLILLSVLFHKSCLETAGIWSVWYNTFDDVEEEELERMRAMTTTSNIKKKLTLAHLYLIDKYSPKFKVEEPGSSRQRVEETSLTEVDELSDGSSTADESRAYEERDFEINVEQTQYDAEDFAVLTKLNFIIFWKLLIDKKKKDMPKDIYIPMLLASLLSLLVSVLGWSQFGKVEGANNKLDVSELISTNYIPSVFLILLLIQFMAMILDRIIYLHRSMLAKYIYQIVLVGVVHVYMFMFQPWLTNESFSSMPAWVAWYFFFCIYFALSAFQIQAGYQAMGNDNIILKNYGYITYWIYLGYMAVPFLWELEVLLNWVCTETTLTLDYWIKYSDIKVYLFKLKCWQVTYEKAYFLGEKQPLYMKYGIGGLLVLLLIFIIWFPLLFMSVVTTNSIPNEPTAFECSLSISGLQPLITLNVQSMPPPLNDTELDHLKDMIRKAQSKVPGNDTDTPVVNAIDGFKVPDVTKLDIPSDSVKFWEISPPAVDALNELLEQDNSLNLVFSWSITRRPESTAVSRVVSGRRILALNGTNRTDLAELIKKCTGTMTIDKLIPTFFLAKETGESEFQQLFPGGNEYDLKKVDLKLHEAPYAVHNNRCVIWNQYYWSFDQISPFIAKPPDDDAMGTHNKVQFYIFSSRVVSSQYQLIASYGIIGLYISVVLVIFKFIRLVLADSSTRIMFHEMPCPDLIMSLVESTEMVRAQEEFVLEQILYRKLLLLYRSPETLIVWTGNHRNLKEE